VFKVSSYALQSACCLENALKTSLKFEFETFVNHIILHNMLNHHYINFSLLVLQKQYFSLLNYTWLYRRKLAAEFYILRLSGTELRCPVYRSCVLFSSCNWGNE